MVPNTSDDLPDPETPVNTVSRRFGISTLTSLRLFSRAPWTRMRSWLSAACGLPEAIFAIVPKSAVRPHPHQRGGSVSDPVDLVGAAGGHVAVHAADRGAAYGQDRPAGYDGMTKSGLGPDGGREDDERDDKALTDRHGTASGRHSTKQLAEPLADR